MSEPANFEPLCSREAELAVLGGMFIDGEAAQRMADELTTGDFGVERCRPVFAAMTRLVARGDVIDFVTLSAELGEHLEKVGGHVLLDELYAAVPSAANIDYWADIIRSHAHRRALKRSLEASLGTVLRPEGRSIADVQELVEREVMRVGDSLRSHDGLVPVKGLLMAEFEAIEKMVSDDPTAVDTIGTGLKDLDEKTTGAERGDLILVAARPSMGKSSLAVGNIIVHNALRQHRRTALFSLETKKPKVVRRLLAAEARVDMQKAKRRRALDDLDYAHLSEAASAINTAPLFIDDTPGATCGHARAALRRLVNEHGPIDVVVFDYLQKMRAAAGKTNRNEEVGEISGELKDLAMEFNCVVFALSQLNRAVEQRPDKRPIMSDLRDSGSLEQDADGILMLYRPEYYFGTQDKKGNNIEGKAEVIIGKWRDGETGSVWVTYAKEYTRFENAAYPRALEAA